MGKSAVSMRRMALFVAVVAGVTWSSCGAPPRKQSNNEGPEETGGEGGSGGGGSGGGGGRGGSSGKGGSGGSGGTGAQPDASAEGGTGGSTPMNGGADGSASGPDTASVTKDAGGPDVSPDTGGISGTPTFTQIYAEILVPGCTAPGACHSVVKDMYFLFAEGMKMRSHMLLVPTPPRAGAIPPRVTTLINHIIPKMANNPNSVDMPPQSGPNLGTPPVRKAPLTKAQVDAITAWALAGAKND